VITPVASSTRAQRARTAAAPSKEAVVPRSPPAEIERLEKNRVPGRYNDAEIDDGENVASSPSVIQVGWVPNEVRRPLRCSSR
jgi:hypothetical protein